MSKTTTPPQGRCQPGYRNPNARKPTAAQRPSFRSVKPGPVSAADRAMIDAAVAARQAPKE